MGEATGEGGSRIYSHHHKQDVDDRSISAPPVLELTAKVTLAACRITPLLCMRMFGCSWHVQTVCRVSGPIPDFCLLTRC